MQTVSRTIVFVHGAWVTAKSWDRFAEPFEAAGYTVHKPSWPGLDGLTADQINNRPPEGFGSLTVGKIADEYEAFIRALPESPIIIGHSFGGLLIQILLDRGLGVAGVAIDPAPIAGVLVTPRALLSALPIFTRWNGWNRTYALSLGEFASKFANAASPDLQKLAHRSYVIPAPGRIFHQAAFWLGTRVNTRARTQPLLITGGEVDRLVTPAMSRATYKSQRRSAARTDLKIFPGRSHFLAAESGWEEVAAAALSWIDTALEEGLAVSAPRSRPVPALVPA